MAYRYTITQRAYKAGGIIAAITAITVIIVIVDGDIVDGKIGRCVDKVPASDEETENSTVLT